jgi:hypothetical protein
VGLLDTLVADAREALSKFTAQIPKPTVGALPDPSSQPAKDPHFFFGQPVTTGPYPMVVGVPQTIQDPNVATAKPSRYVQIQNATGCVLNVVTGVGNFTIQGLAASTIPTDNQLPVTLNPVSGYTNFSEFVKIIWLLDGQSSPMADGTISAPYTPGTPQMTTVSNNFTTGVYEGPVTLLAAPAAETSYLPFSVTYTYTSGGPTGTFEVYIENVGNQGITNPSFSSANPATQTYSLSAAGNVTTAITMIWGGTAVAALANVTINYFVVNS